MKKTIILPLALCLAVLMADAQVQLTPQIPAQGLTLKGQLWNVAVINTYGRDFTARLRLVMTDQSNKQQVFIADSRSFILQKGAKQLRYTDLLPIQFSGINGLYNIDMSPNGFLPVGNFIFCYSLILEDGSKETVNEECAEALVEPLGPPMLISPADNEKVEMPSPLFVWSPPVPVSLFKNLQYELHVVEVLGTQTAGDAVQKNMPLLLQQNIFTTSFQYPLSLPKLDSNKLYAWQIIAKNSLTPVGTSEAWLFRLKKFSPDTTKNKSHAVFFTQLSKDPPHTSTVSNGMIYFEYLNETNTNSASLHLFDITGSKRNELALTETSQSLHFGENFIMLDLRNTTGMSNQHHYLLEMVNAANEHWYFKFQYKIK